MYFLFMGISFLRGDSHEISANTTLNFRFEGALDAARRRGSQPGVARHSAFWTCRAAWGAVATPAAGCAKVLHAPLRPSSRCAARSSARTARAMVDRVDVQRGKEEKVKSSVTVPAAGPGSAMAAHQLHQHHAAFPAAAVAHCGVAPAAGFRSWRPGRRLPAAMASGPAPSGCLPQRRAARCSAARHGLDRPLRIG